eukprot:m.919792 g.919792  ORF g.919792 m.919792 type:complete len:126 (+) comp23754_c0_seq14:3101-3478(+)
MTRRCTDVARTQRTNMAYVTAVAGMLPAAHRAVHGIYETILSPFPSTNTLTAPTTAAGGCMLPAGQRAVPLPASSGLRHHWMGVVEETHLSQVEQRRCSRVGSGGKQPQRIQVRLSTVFVEFRGK